MGRNLVTLVFISVILFSVFSLAYATPPAKIISGIVSNVVYALAKWLWSLKSTTKANTAVSGRSMMKFEGGYNVETVFDGSKMGIDPYAVEVSQFGEILVLDSVNSNIYKISTQLSRYSRPKLIAGSAEGYTGHVDGKLREALMNHPKGITSDDRGNIYVADTLNMAIRKISDAGVVTIAGGKWGRAGGHVDGPSEDAKFSDDFDVIYVESSCSLLVIDRGNQAIREIQLHESDCTHQSDKDLHLGTAVLIAAVFFGYMLALLQRRVATMFSPRSSTIAKPTLNPETRMRKGVPPPPCQRPVKSVRPPLIPPEDEYDKPEDGLFSSFGKLVLYTGSSMVEIFAGLFTSRKTPNHKQPIKYQNAWPMQESFFIPDEDEPPSLEPREHTPERTYPITNKDMENSQRFKQSRSSHGGWDGNFYQQQQQQMYRHHQRHYSSGPETCYEQSREAKEIVFGAVQEQDGQRGAVILKAADYGNPMHGDCGIQSRYNYMGYSHGY